MKQEQNTSQTGVNALAVTEKKIFTQSNDEFLTTLCADYNMGQVNLLRENAGNARSFLFADMIMTAVYDLDIGLIETIIRRIDGSVPDKAKRESYANLFGDALDDVLDYENKELIAIRISDSPLIAMAKAVVLIASQGPTKNPNTRRDRQKASDIILQRTQGRITQPKRLEVQEVFEAPSWLEGLSKEKNV